VRAVVFVLAHPRPESLTPVRVVLPIPIEVYVAVVGSVSMCLPGSGFISPVRERIRADSKQTEHKVIRARRPVVGDGAESVTTGGRPHDHMTGVVEKEQMHDDLVRSAPRGNAFGLSFST